MQFIRLQKLINIAARVLSERVLDWLNTKSVPIVDTNFGQKLWLNILHCRVIEWSKSWMPHCHTFMYFTHWACAVEDLSNHDLLWIIPDPGSQKTITLYLASICTVGFQARASYVKIPAWGQHSCNLGMPYRISIFSTFWGTADQPDQNQGALLWCVADMFSNISNCEIQQPGMLIHLNNRSGESCRMHK